MKKFNELTSTEKLIRLKKEKNLCVFGKWFSILSPYIIIGAVNFEEYFTEVNGVKMSIGCILACLVAGIAIKNEADKSKKISGLVCWAIAFALVYLMNSILQDLLLIVGCGLLGQLVGAGFELGAEDLTKKVDLFYKAQVNAETMKDTNKEI